jgi:hypothetical protein
MTKKCWYLGFSYGIHVEEVKKKLRSRAIDDECQKHHAACKEHKLMHLTHANTLEEPSLNPPSPCLLSLTTLKSREVRT